MGVAEKRRQAAEINSRKKIYNSLLPGNFRRISKDSGVSWHHVSRILRGVRPCSFAVAIKLARAAGVTLDDLRAHIEAMQGRANFAEVASPKDGLKVVDVPEDGK